MKKVSFLIVAAIMAVSSVFVSCTKDDDPAAAPTIQALLKGGTTTGFTELTELTVKVGEPVSFQVTYKAEGKIKQIDFKVGSANVDGFPKVSDKGDFKSKSEISYTATFDTTFVTAGTYTYTTLITDQQSPSLNATTTLTIKVEAATTPLEAAVAFDLTYTGTSQSDGKNINSTYDVKFAAITDATTGKISVVTTGDKFVKLTAKADFDAITTKEGLKAAYDAGAASGIADFTVQSDAKFAAVYFLSKSNDVYYKIQMTNLKFNPGNNVASFSAQK